MAPFPDPAHVAIRAPLGAGDLPGLVGRFCAYFAGIEGVTVHCDVTGIDADAVAVDALARLQLVAHRRSCQVLLVGASQDLVGLVELMGLANVLPAAARPGG